MVATLLQVIWRNWFFLPLRPYRHEQGHETVGETDRKESCGKEGDECDETDEECRDAKPSCHTFTYTEQDSVRTSQEPFLIRRMII